MAIWRIEVNVTALTVSRDGNDGRCGATDADRIPSRVRSGCHQGLTSSAASISHSTEGRTYAHASHSAASVRRTPDWVRSGGVRRRADRSGLARQGAGGVDPGQYHRAAGSSDPTVADLG